MTVTVGQVVRRRSIFRGLPLAAVAYAIPAMTMADDAELRLLGQEFKQAWADEDALYAIEGYDLDAADAASERTSAIVKRINDCPAYTLEGLRIKAAAIAWCHSGDVQLPNAGADMKLVNSIVFDLLRVGQ
jgi:hypothetical protein